MVGGEDKASSVGAILVKNVDYLKAPSRLLWELCGTKLNLFLRDVEQRVGNVLSFSPADDSSMAQFPNAILYAELSGDFTRKFQGGKGDPCSHTQRG